MFAAFEMLLHLAAQVRAHFVIEILRNSLNYVLAVEFHFASALKASNDDPPTFWIMDCR